MRHIFIVGVCLFGSAQFAAAQEGASRQFSSRVGAPVSEAVELLNTDSHAKALAKLNAALALGDLSAYEVANIEKMRGAAFYEMDRLQDAITAFEAAMSSGGFNAKEKDELFVQTAQLMIAVKKPAEGAQMIEDWASRGGRLTPQHIDMLTQAWVQAEDFKRALPWAKKWFAAASPKERKHFDLMNYIYNQLSMPAEQADIVKQMIVRWPGDHMLWGNWGSLLASSGREADAFEVTRLMYAGGFVTTERDILKLVQYHGYFDVPFQGAKILERELNTGRVSTTAENLKKLSNLFRQAREYERAIPILEKAALIDGSKDTYAELAEALIKQGACGQAETAFKSAINKGYGPGKPWMLIGTCRYEAAQEFSKPSCDVSASDRMGSERAMAQNRASKAFTNVKAPLSLRADAQKWVNFIRAEQKAVEDRCDFILNSRKTVCFNDLDQAYKNLIFNDGQIVLRDETCLEFKPEFDAEFRSAASSDEG